MTTTIQREFDVEVTPKALDYNAPQKMGRALWLPMFAMALMAFPVGVIISWVRAAEIASPSPDPETVARLGHLIPAFMFIGFAAVFAAISFAIARILGEFRKGGGDLQESVGVPVQTLEMPTTAKVFIASMMMGMMTIVLMVILHFVAAANAGTWAPDSLTRWAEVLEAFRRLGVTLYLFGITFGLGTIIYVLRFQSIRVRQLAAERS